MCVGCTPWLYSTGRYPCTVPAGTVSNTNCCVLLCVCFVSVVKPLQKGTISFPFQPPRQVECMRERACALAWTFCIHRQTDKFESTWCVYDT